MKKDCKCKHPKHHKKDDDKTDSLWCRTCENKVEDDEYNEDDSWNFYYEQMDRENEERYNNCTCGSYSKDGLQVADCICGNT